MWKLKALGRRHKNYIPYFFCYLKAKVYHFNVQKILGTKIAVYITFIDSHYMYHQEEVTSLIDLIFLPFHPFYSKVSGLVVLIPVTTMCKTDLILMEFCLFW